MYLKHDKDRALRCGVPEVIFGESKTAEDLVDITREFVTDLGRAIITRVSEEKAEQVKASFDPATFEVVHNLRGRVLVIKRKGESVPPIGTIAVLSAGTSDLPVAEEAASLAEELGCTVLRVYDVGIAGIHRVFDAVERVKEASVIIAVAGMEGALPSVVAGLVCAPVIGVPTSVGYGTGAEGKAAILTMLNSCTPLAVVNIDNGYGAAVLAYKMLLMRP